MENTINGSIPGAYTHFLGRRRALVLGTAAHAWNPSQENLLGEADFVDDQSLDMAIYRDQDGNYAYSGADHGTCVVYCFVEDNLSGKPAMLVCRTAATFDKTHDGDPRFILDVPYDREEAYLASRMIKGRHRHRNQQHYAVIGFAEYGPQSREGENLIGAAVYSGTEDKDSVYLNIFSSKHSFSYSSIVLPVDHRGLVILYKPLYGELRRLTYRPIAEFYAIVDGKPRFEHVGEEETAHA